MCTLEERQEDKHRRRRRRKTRLSVFATAFPLHERSSFFRDVVMAQFLMWSEMIGKCEGILCHLMMMKAVTRNRCEDLKKTWRLLGPHLPCPQKLVFWLLIFLHFNWLLISVRLHFSGCYRQNCMIILSRAAQCDVKEWTAFGNPRIFFTLIGRSNDLQAIVRIMFYSFVYCEMLNLEAAVIASYYSARSIVVRPNRRSFIVEATPPTRVITSYFLYYYRRLLVQEMHSHVSIKWSIHRYQYSQNN